MGSMPAVVTILLVGLLVATQAGKVVFQLLVSGIVQMDLFFGSPGNYGDGTGDTGKKIAFTLYTS